MTEDEKRFVLLQHKFSAGGETGVAEKEEFSWDGVGQVFKVDASAKKYQFRLCWLTTRSLYTFTPLF